MIPGIGMAPWFMTVGIATMIFELARRRWRKQLSSGSELLLGARVPIILTSRADSVLTRLASCAVASLIAEDRRIHAAKAVS